MQQLLLALLLAGAAFVPSAQSQMELGAPGQDETAAIHALSALNNYLDMISFTDSCFRESSLEAIEPLQPRIRAARAAAVARFGRPGPSAETGDTDFVCHRVERPAPSRRAIRRHALKLIKQLEAAARPVAPGAADRK